MDFWKIEIFFFLIILGINTYQELQTLKKTNTTILNMYTSRTATREKALLAAAAAERAMDRSACCKSQFKFKCFSCGEMINRGDKITRCIRTTTGMKLRYRGADANNGLTMEETTFYQGESGKDLWVHPGCIPCFWDKGLDEDGNRLTRPALRPICTEWGVKVYGEWDELTEEDVWYKLMGVPYYCKVKGYPEEKFMRDRIVHAVKRFQALWRGYIYKKAYPIARRQARALEAINLTKRVTLSTIKPGDRAVADAEKEAEFWEQWRKSAAATSARCGALWDKWLGGGEGATGQEVPDLITKRQRETHISMSKFFHETKGREGSNTAILFDRGRKKETIYSCEILNVRIEPAAVYVYVRFHYDQEQRVYHWRKFQELERECHTFMKNKGIILTAFEGKISTRTSSRNKRD